MYLTGCLPYLWRTIKYEEVSIHDYASPKEARHLLRDYVQFYNHQRLHQSLDDQTPAAVYFWQTG
jgi:putative transposase